MFNFKVKFHLILILFISSVSIISAYFIEFVLGHQPCNLCLLERIPYGLSVILILINFITRKNEKFFLLLLSLIFAFSFIISLYHLGIEQGFFEEPGLCGLKSAASSISKEEILKQLSEKNISCKDVTFKIFGLSLTSINVIMSFLLNIILIKTYITYDKVK